MVDIPKINDMMSEFPYVYIYEAVGRSTLVVGFNSEPLELPTIMNYKVTGKIEPVTNEQSDSTGNLPIKLSEPPVGFTCSSDPCLNKSCLFHKNHPEFEWGADDAYDAPFNCSPYFWIRKIDNRATKPSANCGHNPCFNYACVYHNSRPEFKFVAGWKDDSFFWKLDRNDSQERHLLRNRCSNSNCLVHGNDPDYVFTSDYGEASAWWLTKKLNDYEEDNAHPPVEMNDSSEHFEIGTNLKGIHVDESNDSN